MADSPRVVATLIARGGGSSFHRKNAYRLLGKPVLTYAIETLQGTDFVTDIFLWTEDEELREIGLDSGIHVITRPRSMVHYAGGFHTLDEWYHNRADQIITRIGALGDFEVGYNCNNILVRPQSLNAMYHLLRDNADRACRVQAVTRVDPGLCMKTATGELFPFWNDPERLPQDHPPLFRLMGIVVNDRVKCSDSRYTTIYHELPPEEAMDFQHAEDIPYAEWALFQRSKLHPGEGTVCA